MKHEPEQCNDPDAEINQCADDDSEASAAGLILDGYIDEEAGEWTDDAMEG